MVCYWPHLSPGGGGKPRLCYINKLGRRTKIKYGSGAKRVKFRVLGYNPWLSAYVGQT